MFALTTPESVFLAIAVVGLCAGIAQAAAAGGSPRRAGVIVAGVVATGAVLTFALLAFVLPAGDADDNARAYQSRVQEICDDNRALETRLNRRMTALQRESSAEPAAYMSGWTDLVARFAYASRQLSDSLEALEPPSSREDTHQEAVLVWQRLARQFDQTAEAARLAGTPQEAAAAVNDASGGSQGDRLDSSRDALLRKLAGTGCDPSLPVSVLAE